jgi:prepilin-type N-terminal cleavage/methylation domain-containing protein
MIYLNDLTHRRLAQRAYSLIEVVVALSLMLILFTSLFAGLSWGFSITQVTRENLRATQIMLEHVEGIRLYSWNQLVYSNWLPANFTNYYYPLTNHGESPGIAYSGTMTVTDPPFSNNYSANLRAVTVTVNWTSNRTPRSRSMTTFASEFGMQNYIFNH